MSELIHWVDVKDQLPDDETTVLIYSAKHDEPVWFGFYEANAWFLPDGMPLLARPTHWADMPAGPADATHEDNKMKKTDFCGVTDVIDCIRDDVYRSIDAITIANDEKSKRQLNEAIKHTERLLKRLNEVRGISKKYIRVNAWNNQGLIMAQAPGLGDDDSNLNATLILDDGVVL